MSGEIPQFTPEQVDVLARFADYYSTGRRFGCFVFRSVVAIGAIVTALASIFAFLHQYAGVNTIMSWIKLS